MNNQIHVAIWTLFQIQPMSCEYILTQMLGRDHPLYDHLLSKLRGYCSNFTDANAHRMAEDSFNVPGFLQFYIGLTSDHQLKICQWLGEDTQSATYVPGPQ